LFLRPGCARASVSRAGRACHTPSTYLADMTKEAALRILAEIQHSLVAIRQARRLGFDYEAIDRRVRSGEWVDETTRVLRRVGGQRTRDQELMLGVLDGPPGSVLAACSAAEAWGLPSFNGMPIEIVHRRHGSLRPRPIARVHRPRLLLPHHVTELRGIPIETLPRVLFDIAALVHEERLDVIIDRVVAKSPGVLDGLRAMLPELAQRGRPGIAVMRRQLAKRPVGYVPVASGLERRFDKLAREAGVKQFRRQVDVGGHEWIGRVDFVDEFHLLYEVDSILHHTTPGDVARDAVRDRALKAAGFADVVRVPEEDIWYHPDRAVARVRGARAPYANRAVNPRGLHVDLRPGS
jgi:very-short-patch-repair endonuclease